MKHYDVIIVGAGLAGIGAAYHLQSSCPSHSYAILESKSSIGGTWDLFKYPGVGPDSDMYTMSYTFKPWSGDERGTAEEFKKYIKETAEENNISDHIQFDIKVQHASWDSTTSIWTVKCNTVTYTCNFLFMCSGYYDHESAYTPSFEGMDTFNGTIVHPQFWPDNLDYSNKEITVIGSGATAVGLIPELAKTAKHVTMLQRSPSYFTSNEVINQITKKIPMKIKFSYYERSLRFVEQCFKTPDAVREQIKLHIQQVLGKNIDDKNFTPSYNPWEQRLSIDNNDQLLHSIKNQKVSIVTDYIDRFIPTGIKLKSGNTINSDIIVTATGFNMKLLGGIEFVVDDTKVNIADTISYKGAMLSNLPNLTICQPYYRLSATIKYELICQYTCRLLTYMKQHNYKKCIPIPSAEVLANLRTPPANLTGYFKRALSILPKESSCKPWHSKHHYSADVEELKLSNLEDDQLKFS